MPVALALMISGAVAEGFGILALLPVLAIAAGEGNLPKDLATWVGPQDGLGEDARLLVALTMFVLVMAIRSILLLARDRYLAKLSADYEASLKLRSAASLAEQGWERAARAGQAGMQSLLLSDIPRCNLAIHQAQVALVCAIMLTVQTAIALALSATMAIVALLIIAVGLAASTIWLPKARQTGTAISRHHELTSAAAVRLHSGLKSALAQGTVPEFLAEYRTTLGRLATEVVDAAGQQARSRAVGGIAAAFVAALLLILGDRILELPFAMLLTLLIIFARMSGPAQQLQQSLQLFSTHSPAFNSITERVGSLASLVTSATELEAVRWDSIALEMASYRHSAESGVDDLDFRLTRGEWVALQGQSGAGKTTIADLLCGLLRPDDGQVLLDGAPLEGKLLDRWRREIAYVPQGDSVFDDSIRANLVAGGGKAESDDDLWASLELTGLAERVRRRPGGLDSDAGGRGSALSGGERQRLVLARALLRRPSLLILDEATNALDAESERELLMRLRGLDPRASLLIVTHRPGPAELCDRTVTVEAGRIVRQ